eukprot:ANDGO_03863.mRNA.1 Protein ApaG
MRNLAITDLPFDATSRILRFLDIQSLGWVTVTSEYFLFHSSAAQLEWDVWNDAVWSWRRIQNFTTEHYRVLRSKLPMKKTPSSSSGGPVTAEWMAVFEAHAQLFESFPKLSYASSPRVRLTEAGGGSAEFVRYVQEHAEDMDCYGRLRRAWDVLEPLLGSYSRNRLADAVSEDLLGRFEEDLPHDLVCSLRMCRGQTRALPEIPGIVVEEEAGGNALLTLFNPFPYQKLHLSRRDSVFYMGVLVGSTPVFYDAVSGKIGYSRVQLHLPSYLFFVEHNAACLVRRGDGWDSHVHGSTTWSLDGTLRITVFTRFIGLRESEFMWTYRICIHRAPDAPSTIQLVSRSWTIHFVDRGNEYVQGPGVVGFTPVLEPGASFEYSSFVTAALPSVAMSGYFVFTDLRSHEEVRGNIDPYFMSIDGESVVFPLK